MVSKLCPPDPTVASETEDARDGGYDEDRRREGLLMMFTKALRGGG